MKLIVKCDERSIARLQQAVEQDYTASVEEAVKAGEAGDEYPCLVCGGWVALSAYGECVSRSAVQSCGGARITVYQDTVILEGRRGSFADLPWSSACSLETLHALLGALLGAQVVEYTSEQPWRRIAVGVANVRVQDGQVVLDRTHPDESPEIAGNCPECGVLLGQDAVWVSAEAHVCESARAGYRCPACSDSVISTVSDMAVAP